VAWGVDEAERPLELGLLPAGRALLGGGVALGLIAVRALVDGEVGVSELYSDAPLQLLAVSGDPLTGQSLD